MRHARDRRVRNPAPNDDRPVTIRIATMQDASTVRRLEQLDGVPGLTGDVMLAELDDAPLAAVSLETGAVAADPFQHTAFAVLLLKLRRRQILSVGAAPARRSVPAVWLMRAKLGR